MTDGDRKSGIDIIGSVPWGTHFCQFYQTSQDLIEVLVPYFKAGLENNEFCMWVTSEPLHVEEAKTALGKEVRNLDSYIQKGQIEFFSHDGWYLKDGLFDQRRVLAGWVSKLEQALARGYSGMRLTGNTFWLEKDDWRSFAEYEEEVDRVIGNYRMIAVCSYSLTKCGAPEVIDVVSNHKFALIRRESKWVAIESAEQARAEEALQKSEELYRALFENMLNGFAYCQILLDENNQPVDFIYLEVNDAFEKLTGLKKRDVIGRKVTESIPEIKEAHPELFNIYGKVALTGEPAKFDLYFKPLQIWLNISVYSPQRGYFVAVFDNITEHKRTEAELRQSEANFRRSVDDSPLGIRIVTAVGETIYANRAMLDIYGYQSLEELKATPVMERYTPESYAKHQERKERRKRGVLVPPNYEIGIVRKDGETRYLSVSRAEVIWNGEKQFQTLYQDITESKKQEKRGELTRRLLEIANLGRQLEPTLKEFVRAIREYTDCEAAGIRILDSEGNIPYRAYEGFSRQFYDSESPLSINLHQCLCIYVIQGKVIPNSPFYSEDGSFYTNSLTDLLATVPEEEHGVTRDACRQQGYESMALVPLRLGEKIVGLVHIADRRKNMVPLDLVNTLEDVMPQIGLSVRRLWAEQELTEEKGRLEVTLRSTGDGIIATDMSGMVVLLNRAAEQLIGWTQKEAVGKPIREVFYIIDERNRQPIPDPIGNVLKTGRVIGLVNHAVLISRDGTERVIADSGAPIHDDQGRTFGAVLVFRDITESKRLEEEQLKVAKLESIGVLAGGIAHDFNNLLTAIMGNISLARRHVEPQGKAAERLDEAERASVRARDLTQQLLTFAKGGAPVKKAASISELIKETATFALSGSDVGLELSLPEDLWVVEIDEGQMSQVIQNIVINADEAMPSGGTLHISAVNIAIQRLGALPLPKGNYVRIDIKDEGIGMSKQQLARIFEPYYTTKQKGSGLGLATAYSIIANHDGYITAESTQDVGSTFHIYLPASSKPKPVKRKPRGAKPVSGKGKILVMDDEETIRAMLIKMLAPSGYDVAVTKDGAEAVEAYRQASESGKPFDAVILDLTVPGGMGGKETIEKLLEIDPKVKAIVSSGYATDPVMAEYKKYGFSAVVTKPYNVSQMEETLHDILAGK